MRHLPGVNGVLRELSASADQVAKQIFDLSIGVRNPPAMMHGLLDDCLNLCFVHLPPRSKAIRAPIRP